MRAARLGRRALGLLGLAASLAGCVTQPYGQGAGVATPLTGGPPRMSADGARVALLVPMTGARAELGKAFNQAAMLAMEGQGAPPLDVRDTGGTPDGAARAAREAVGGGAKIIVGPLTSLETGAVAPIADAAHVPVLAFTNDASQGRPGVWTLGITADQQVSRLVAAARSEGKRRFAALVPENDFGRAMAEALRRANGIAGEPAQIRAYPRGKPAIEAALRDLTGGRAKGSGPPPFDALLLADTGDALGDIVSLLPAYGVSPATVRVLGPALWSTPNSGALQIQGAWYAAPDPAARNAFNDSYAAKYGGAAPSVSDLAFDAASIARVVATTPGVTLTQPAGFGGVDGVLALNPDGSVRRGLAVYEVRDGAAPVISPAPAALPGAPPGI